MVQLSQEHLFLGTSVSDSSLTSLGEAKQTLAHDRVQLQGFMVQIKTPRELNKSSSGKGLGLLRAALWVVSHTASTLSCCVKHAQERNLMQTPFPELEALCNLPLCPGVRRVNAPRWRKRKLFLTGPADGLMSEATANLC